MNIRSNSFWSITLEKRKQKWMSDPAHVTNHMRKTKQKWISDPAIHERNEDHITDYQSENAIERKNIRNEESQLMWLPCTRIHIESHRHSYSESDFHWNVSLSFAGNRNEYHANFCWHAIAYTDKLTNSSLTSYMYHTQSYSNNLM